MKRLIILAFPLALMACQDGKITPAETALTACQTYTAALNTATALNTAGKLSAKAVVAVDKSVAIADPLCGGPAPKYDGSALDAVSVQSAIAMINAAIGE
jgi:hypothetical protein